MTKRKVRIEEVLVGVDEEFSKNLWIESDTLQYADPFYENNEHWIVVEVKEMNTCTFCGREDDCDTKVVGSYTILEVCADCEDEILEDE